MMGGATAVALATVASVALAAFANPAGAAKTTPTPPPTPTSRLLHRDTLIDADMWDRRPRMMAAGLGFTGIIGMPGISTSDLATGEQRVRAVGGAWNNISCAAGETPPLSAYTSASTPQAVALSFGYPTVNSDGLPVEFSWPVRPSTLDASDFRVSLSNGKTVTPQLAALFPNAEYNERSTVVLFGKFGNRLAPQNPGSAYPIKTRVVRGSTRLQLVGPHDRLVSAIGMSAKSSTTPYAQNRNPTKRSGPHLVAAKLTRMSARGDTAPPPFNGALPNDGVSLYGSAAKFRLRVFTSGGFSPDGVRAVFPTEFSRYFRLKAKGDNGRTVLLTKTGVDYHLGGGGVRILGLADLGHKQSNYDDCYVEDKDNQIDIVLGGDERAVRRITAVEIPATGRYSPFYNPGGPGNDPTAGVRYTAPGPSQVQPVLNALSDPMQVTFIR
jgi:hypothetical protein